MGNSCVRFIRERRLKRKIILLMIGLDNAGKTQTVNNLIGDAKDSAIPTVGFKAVNLVHRNTPVVIFDLGGGPEFRQIWPVYYSEVHGVIFVIDASDFARLDECKEVLAEVLSHERISGKPVLILANKQDQDGALDDLDIVEKLSIEATVNKYRCPTLVEPYSANLPLKQKRGIFSQYPIDPGLKNGYLWLLNYILKRYGDINLRVQTDMNTETIKIKAQEELKRRQTDSLTNDDLDVVVATGFANLKYNENFAEDDDFKSGVINVKPATQRNSAVSRIDVITPNDTTISSEAALLAPTTARLSPLFGEKRKECENANGGKIEIESRRHMAKLSPLPSKKSDSIQHIALGDSKAQTMASSRSNSPKSQKVIQSISATVERHIASVPASVGPDTDSVIVKYDNKAAGRPLSASQVVRRQLEQVGPVQQQPTRKLSLKNLRRNRTNPEEIKSSALFSYDPLQQNKNIIDGRELKVKTASLEMNLVAKDRGVI